MATMHTAPSYKAFHTFCTRCEVEVDEDNPIIGYTTHLILDDDDEDSEQVQAPEAPDAKEQGVDWNQAPKTPVSFDLDATEGTDAPAIIEDKEDTVVRDNPAAELVEPHVGSQDAGHGKTRLAPQEAGKMLSSNLHKLLIWKRHKETLEDQAKTWASRWQASNGHRAGTVRQRRPTAVHDSRAHCPNERLAHQKEVPRGDCLCRSFQRFVLHSSAKVN